MNRVFIFKETGDLLLHTNTISGERYDFSFFEVGEGLFLLDINADLIECLGEL